jgi:hypothetical protein
MSLKRTHFAVVASLCFLGTSTIALAQVSAPGSTSTAPGPASPAGTSSAPASVPSGNGPTPEPTPGQSVTIAPNTRATPQGIGPSPAPTPGQSTMTGPRPLATVDNKAPTDALTPAPKPRQSRMRNARTPRQAETVGSGSSRPESPARTECFVTPNISKEPGQSGNQPPIGTPRLSPITGRPAATTPRC